MEAYTPLLPELGDIIKEYLQHDIVPQRVVNVSTSNKVIGFIDPDVYSYRTEIRNNHYVSIIYCNDMETSVVIPSCSIRVFRIDNQFVLFTSEVMSVVWNQTDNTFETLHDSKSVAVVNDKVFLIGTNGYFYEYETNTKIRVRYFNFKDLKHLTVLGAQLKLTSEEGYVMSRDDDSKYRHLFYKWNYITYYLCNDGVYREMITLNGSIYRHSAERLYPFPAKLISIYAFDNILFAICESNVRVRIDLDKRQVTTSYDNVGYIVDGNNVYSIENNQISFFQIK